MKFLPRLRLRLAYLLPLNRLLLYLEVQRRPPDLHPPRQPPDLHLQLVLLHQRPELRLTVKHVETVAHVLYQGVVAGYRNVSDADLAFVTPSQLYSIGGHVLNHHHALHFFTRPLQNDVISLRLLNWEQLFQLSLRLDDHGQFVLAHFALEFVEVEVECAADDLLLDFEVDPLGEALKVDSAAGAHTLAGIEEEVGVSLEFLEADFAGIFVFLVRGLEFENFAIGVGVIFDANGIGSEGDSAFPHFADEVLDPSQFDGLAWC